MRTTWIVGMALLCAAAPAAAEIIRVGSATDPACHFSDPVAALAHIQSRTDGPHELRISSGDYHNVAGAFDRSLGIKGGFANCSVNAARTGTSVLHGTGLRPVLIIWRGRAAVTASLSNLRITGGKAQFFDTEVQADKLGFGGGLRIHGGENFQDIRVTLQDVDVESNIAELGGGGIWVSYATLELLQGTRVRFNVQSSGIQPYGGGGIMAEHANLSIRSDGVLIEGNDARYRMGGGLYARLGSTVTIGSVGTPAVQLGASGAVIRNNIGMQGGGIALSEGTVLDARELTVEGNEARHVGGGIYAQNAGTIVRLQRDYVAGGVECAFDTPCLRLVDNVAGTDTGHQTPDGCPGNFGSGGGAFLNGASGFFRQIVISDNCAADGSAITSHGPELEIEGAVIARNRLGRDVIQVIRYNTPNWTTRLRHLTMFGNVRQGGTPARAVSNTEVNVDMQGSALDGALAWAGACNVGNVGAAAYADAANDDFRPLWTSGLVDGCAVGTVPTTVRDLRLAPRCIDLPGGGTGACDIGAIEAVEAEATTTAITSLEHDEPLMPGDPVLARVVVTGTTSRPPQALLTVSTAAGDQCSTSELAATGSLSLVGYCTLRFAFGGEKLVTATYHGSPTHYASSGTATVHVVLPSAIFRDGFE